MKAIAVSTARLVEPETAGIINDLVGALFQGNRLEEIMVYENDEKLALGKRAVEVDEARPGAGKLHRKAARIGLDNVDLRAKAARERRRNLNRGALAKIVDIGLEGETEARD